MSLELLFLALDFYRAPLRYSLLTEPERPLPRGFEALLGQMGTALLPSNLASAAERLQRPPQEIEAAARFFVRQVLLLPGADHYRVLGLSPNAGEVQVRQHYQLLVRLFHPDRMGEDQETEGSETARLNLAYQTLRDPEERYRYDRALETDGRRNAPAPSMREVLRPAGPMRDWRRAGSWPPLWLPKLRWVLAGSLIVGVLLAVPIFTLVGSGSPGLRMSEDRAERPPPLPAYLQGGRREHADAPATPPPAADGVVVDRVAANTQGEEEEAVGPSPQPVMASAANADTAARGPALAQATRQSSGELETADRMVPVPSKGKAPAPSADPSGMSSAEAGAVPTPAEARQAPAGRTLAEDGGGGEPKGGNQTTLARVERREPEEQSSAQTPSETDRSRGAVSAAKNEVAAEAADRGGATTAAETGARGAHEEPSRRSAPDPRSEPAATPSRQAPPTNRPSGAAAAAHGAPADRELAADPREIVWRFMRAYEQGDLAAFVGLFVADAQINEGRGREFIRAHYADFFRRVPARRFTVQSLRWRESERRSVVLNTRARIASKPRGSDRWRHWEGGLRFELVRQDGGYRIAKMLHGSKAK